MSALFSCSSVSPLPARPRLIRPRPRVVMSRHLARYTSSRRARRRPSPNSTGESRYSTRSGSVRPSTPLMRCWNSTRPVRWRSGESRRPTGGIPWAAAAPSVVQRSSKTVGPRSNEPRRLGQRANVSEITLLPCPRSTPTTAPRATVAARSPTKRRCAH